MKTTKNSRVMRILVAVLVICTITCTMLANSVFAQNEKVTGARDGVFQVKLNYTDDDNKKITVNSGTAFLINENTLITCYHVVSLEPEDVDWMCEAYNKSSSEIQSRLSVSITVSRDVTVPANILTHSEDMDFAILRLTSTLQKKTPLAIRSSSTVKQIENVYAIGFPSTSALLQNYNTYTSGDATITTGQVNKISTGVNLFSGKTTDYIQTSCNLDFGNSGGPMVDENGAVVGISQGVIGDEVTEFYNAVAIDQVVVVLDTMGIPYTAYDPAPPQPTEPTVDPTEPQVTEPSSTEATLPTLPSIIDDTEPAKEGMDSTTLILIIAAVAVVLIVIVVVIIMVSGKKSKPAPAPASVHPAFTAPEPVATFGGMSTMSSGFAPPPPTAPVPGAGETTVLTPAAGETTVLSRSAVSGGSLVRKRTGETITVNSDNFVIGRERKNVNYCISDNSSVSRTHVRLTIRGGVTYLTDLNAANGTFVNGVKVTPHHEIALKSGDKITLADEELEYRN